MFLTATAFLAILISVAIHIGAGKDPGKVITPPSTAKSDSITTDFSDYDWPTDAGRKTTSTFAEFRRTHFHGGIDIGTGSTTGYHVFAMRDGYVARIRISPLGYGKMLFLRHADGYYTTYAHLKHFNVEIDARVLQEQKRLEQYPVDIECKPNEFPVHKGDIIAYTGDTGVGSPHLHFEIRDQNLDPVNPLLGKNLQITDNLPPTIRKIAVTPLRDNSSVNGDWNPRIYKARALKADKYKIVEPIQITGEVGFAVDARDRSNGSWFKHGVYGHDLFIDDSLIYSVQLDRVPGEDSHQIGLYYDWSLLNQGRGRFERLYSDSPSSLRFHTPKGDISGIVNSASFSEGPHSFKIVSRDFNDNRSELTGKLILNHAPHFEIEYHEQELQLKFSEISRVSKIFLQTKRNGSDTWSLKTLNPDAAEDNVVKIPIAKNKYDVVKVVAENQWGTKSRPQFIFINRPAAAGGHMTLDHEFESDFVRLTVKTSSVFTSPPTIIVNEGNSRRVISTMALDINKYIGAFRPLETFSGTRRLVAQGEITGHEATANDEFDLYPIVAGDSGTFSADNGNLILSYTPSSVFKTVFLRIEKSSYHNNEIYVLSPENTILNAGLTASVRVNPNMANQGLYLTGGGRDELVTSTVHGEWRTGKITRSFGELALVVDDTPPNVSSLSVTRTSTTRPTISFRYGDNLSGVDYDGLKIYIDDKFVVPEVDGEHHRVLCQVTDPLDRGSHQLIIRLRDLMGNSREVERRFVVR